MVRYDTGYDNRAVSSIQPVRSMHMKQSPVSGVFVVDALQLRDWDGVIHGR